MMAGEDENLEMKTALNLVLYELYHLNSIKDVKFDEKGASYYMRMPEEKRARIKKALDWAVENQEQDFNRFLPNQQHLDNDDIIYFLETLKVGFEEFGVAK